MGGFGFSSNGREENTDEVDESAPWKRKGNGHGNDSLFQRAVESDSRIAVVSDSRGSTVAEG